MTVNYNTIQAEGRSSFFNRLGKICAKAGKKLGTIVIKIAERALEIASNFCTAAASRSPKAALSSLPELTYFYHTGKGLCFGKIVEIFI